MLLRYTLKKMLNVETAIKRFLEEKKENKSKTILHLAEFKARIHLFFVGQFNLQVNHDIKIQTVNARKRISVGYIGVVTSKVSQIPFPVL